MADRVTERGEALLREADLQAERLVSIARIATAVTLLFVIWLFTEPKDLEIEHVATVIGAARISLLVLFVSGAVSLFMVLTGRWRPWTAFWTVTVDSGVVVYNMWTSLKATGLAGDFTMAIPSTVAVILVLGTNALRMRPWVQTYSTVLLIGAMLAVGFQAGHLDVEQRRLVAGEMGATMFGVTPNAVRIIMITLTGLVLVVAAVRGRRLLLRAVRESTLRANLGRYVPAELAPVLEAGRIGALKAGQRSALALLFVDIRNSTAMEEMLDAAALSAFIGTFRHHVTQAVTGHGGVIDKFVGDGAFVVFGIIEPKPDDATRAIRCGQDILAAIAQWSAARVAAGEAPVAVGVGVHFGEAFVGAIGDEARLEFTVLGDAVNVAHRLEQATKDHGLPMLVSQEALAAGGEDISRWRELGAERLRGRSAAVMVFAPLARPDSSWVKQAVLEASRSGG